MFKISKNFVVAIGIILLAGCAADTGAAPTISEVEYKQALGLAICAVVDELNARGELDDEAAISENFDKLLEQNLNEMGYPSDDWLAAKTKYFPDEAEHTKLVKMHFTWCLVGDSVGGENSDSQNPVE